MSQIVFYVAIISAIPFSYFLYRVFHIDRQLLTMLNIVFYSILVLVVGLLYSQATIACGIIFEIGIILIYCEVYPFCLRIVKRYKFKHFGILSCYIFPSIIIYALSTYAITGLFNHIITTNSNIANNISNFMNYMIRINETVGFGFIVNAIFQYFNDNKKLLK